MPPGDLWNFTIGGGGINPGSLKTDPKGQNVTKDMESMRLFIEPTDPKLKRFGVSQEVAINNGLVLFSPPLLGTLAIKDFIGPNNMIYTASGGGIVNLEESKGWRPLDSQTSTQLINTPNSTPILKKTDEINENLNEIPEVKTVIDQLKSIFGISPNLKIENENNVSTPIVRNNPKINNVNVSGLIATDKIKPDTSGENNIKKWGLALVVLAVIYKYSK